MDFSEILTKAWKTIWKHKILWLFGLLAGCGAANSGGGGGGGGGNAVYSGQSGSMNEPSMFGPGTQRTFQEFTRFISDIPVWVWILLAIVLLVLGVILSVLFLMVGTVGTSGVIAGTGMADEAGAEEKPLSFKVIFNALKPYYWKVFLLNLGLRVGGFIIMLFLIVPIILLVVLTCGLGLFLLIPLAWFIDLMVNFTTIAIIEEDKGIFDGIRRAWQVITKNLGNVLLMFLILGIGQLIAGLIIALPLIVVPVPLLINLLTSSFLNWGLIVSGVLFLAFIPLVVFLSAVLRAYVLSSWTLTYRRLTGENVLTPTVLSDEPVQEESAPDQE